jgi:hypothetical protein
MGFACVTDDEESKTMGFIAWKRPVRLVVAVALATAALLGCGGGGGGAARQSPPATLVQDTNPTGSRVAGPSNLFPLAAGDTTSYVKSDANGFFSGTVTRVVTSGILGSGSVVVTETDTADPFNSVSANYTKSASGLTLRLENDPDLPAAVASLIGSVIEYPEPMYPVGSVRTALRQGSWGSDITGDGMPEGFRFTFTQIFRGFESLTFAGKTLSVAHFSNTATVTLISSDPTDPPISIFTLEESYFTAGFGLVKSVREAKDSLGLVVFPRHTLEIASANIGGQDWNAFLSPVDGTVAALALIHNALVFDSGRGVYYASVPNSASSNANTIATVNPVSGTTSFTAPLALDPGAMAISTDHSTLYVYGNNNLIRLALPGLTETGRVSLPSSAFCGSNSAESIAVSPTDASIVAVSLANAGCSPRHEGVVLYRNLVEQPNRTPGHTGSNEIVFSPNGVELFGLNTETTEWGLRRMSVIADGLTQTAVVTTGGAGLLPKSIDASATQVVLPNAVHSSLNLTKQGDLPGQGCRLVPPRIVCVERPGTFSTLNERLIVVDATIQVPLIYLRFGVNDSLSPNLLLTPGPAQQVAISSTGNGAYYGPYTSLRLFSSSQLP